MCSLEKYWVRQCHGVNSDNTVVDFRIVTYAGELTS